MCTVDDPDIDHAPRPSVESVTWPVGVCCGLEVASITTPPGVNARVDWNGGSGAPCGVTWTTQVPTIGPIVERESGEAAAVGDDPACGVADAGSELPTRTAVRATPPRMPAHARVARRCCLTNEVVSRTTRAAAERIVLLSEVVFPRRVIGIIACLLSEGRMGSVRRSPNDGPRPSSPASVKPAILRQVARGTGLPVAPFACAPAVSAEGCTYDTCD